MCYAGDMSETGPSPELSDEQKLRDYEDMVAGRLPNNDRTYLMAHAANAEVDKTEGAIDPDEAAEGAGRLYNKGLNDREYDYILAEGLTEEQRDQLAHAIHPESEITKYFDAMTGLSNRNSFEVARPRADEDSNTAFVEFDLNKLKAKNDLGGHELGDESIREAARRLIQAGLEFGLNARSIFRVGGDEFVVILPTDKAEAFQRRAHELFDDYMSAIGPTYSEADKKLMALKKARDDQASSPPPYEFPEL